LEQNKQNDGQNQDGRQAWIFHSSFNFYAYQLKLGIWKKRPIKKNIVEVSFFSKLQNGVSNHRFFLLALTNSHFSTDFKM
jgi:hypothetical protein